MTVIHLLLFHFFLKLSFHSCLRNSLIMKIFNNYIVLLNIILYFEYLYFEYFVIVHIHFKVYATLAIVGDKQK